MGIVWTPHQEAALREIDRWLRDPGGKQYFYLAGYPGTGKSELARAVRNNIDGPVVCAAYTGKAALVMIEKGLTNATTIHRSIYIPRGKSKERLQELEERKAELVGQLHAEAVPGEDITGHPEVLELAKEIALEQENMKRPTFTLNQESPVRYADLVIIDEISMVGASIAEDLLSFGTKVLVIGDPMQLPPVKDTGYFTAREPDFFLTELHRYAGPIARMCEIGREKGYIPVGEYGENKVIPRSKIDLQEVVDSEQILVGMNRTRLASNRRMRKLLDLPGDYPVLGDRLVCLRNNHEVGLLNGAIWNVVGPVEDNIDHLVATVADDNYQDRMIEVEMHKPPFVGGELPWYEERDYEKFDFGYALTVHKAQGSQYDTTYVFDEWPGRDTRCQWINTAVSRTVKRNVTVRMDLD